jgi:hypothetical protein
MEQFDRTKQGQIIRCYRQGREFALVLIHWVVEQLLPTFNLAMDPVTSPNCGDFIALALCNKKLHDVDH